jgi:LuxR family maltose regulon positive regulatory protein
MQKSRRYVEQLLSTKLYIPPTRPQLVLRPRLIERLNESLHRKLTLISAPAGFGKTTLVSEWIASSTRPVAWLSLDEGDNDPTRFLAYLVAALQTVVANIGEGVLRILQSPQPPTESILTALLNEITTISHNFILVLDDYHVINAKPVDHALNFLIEHLPLQMHLVITTREDPDIPLARLRARDQLNELRAVDLRFTSHEAAEFLNQVMGLDLSAEEVAALESRTEGWIAGLQLAALSMQGREDVPRFIRAFAGDNRYIVDYLVEEVLQRQPERVRSFLLQTSILDRLSGSLCDAVADQEEGNVLLEALERGNLFVVPLDDTRHWFRYHHLFGEVLQAHLKEERPDQVPSLHRRASEWYEHNGLPADAIRHALAAEDFWRAADLIEMIWPAMDGRFQSATWLGWVKALPDELVRARPVLSVAYAWALLNGGELEAGEARLSDAEQWLDTTADMSQRPEALSAQMVVVDEAQFRSLPASIATARAYHAQALGDIPGSVKYARRALNLLPEADHLRRGPAAALLGLSQWASGELEAAHQALADAMAGFQMAGNMHFAISVTYGLADIKIAQGRLREAISTYKRSLHIVAQQGESLVRGTADLYLGLSGLYLEQGDEEAARQHLLRSEELGEQAALPDWPYRFRLAQARIKEIQGDLDGALYLLEEAERFYYRGPVPDVHPIAALKARVWVVQGRLTEALGWVGERGLSPDDDLSYLREFEHITLARLLIAQSKRDHEERSTHSVREAMGLLERLLKAAEEGGRMGSVIAILVLQALAYEAHGDVPSALQFLERALILAEPEGYVRMFVDEGMPMATLLRETAKHGITPNYVSQLRAVFGKAGYLMGNTTPVTPLLIEPLSERELQVLRLLGTELDGPEIARELMVSLNTMRTHTKNIYNKLGVNSRRAAVRRAQELDLL